MRVLLNSARGTTDNRKGKGEKTGHLSRSQFERVDRHHGTKTWTAWRGLDAYGF